MAIAAEADGKGGVAAAEDGVLELDEGGGKDDGGGLWEVWVGEAEVLDGEGEECVEVGGL